MALAIECNEIVQSKCDLLSNNVASTKFKAECIQNIANAYISELLKSRYVHITPLSVSKLLLCLQRLRQSLDYIFDLSVKEQEELAWSILNSCKLIIEIAQPLVCLNCGKYVTETLLYAALCLDSTINLCTVRHMKFRMKIYTTAFYSVLVQGSLDEANAIIARTNKQYLELKEREAIYYFYYEKLSYEQIAIIFEFSHVSSARRLIYRGLGNLRKFIPLSILGLMVDIASNYENPNTFHFIYLPPYFPVQSH